MEAVMKNVVYTSERVDVVRCRDCEYKRRGGCVLTLDGKYNGDDWFCADGKRRNEYGEH